MESDWARDRDKLVKTIMPVGSTVKSQSSRPTSLTSSSNTLLNEAANGQSQYSLVHNVHCLILVKYLHRRVRHMQTYAAKNAGCALCTAPWQRQVKVWLLYCLVMSFCPADCVSTKHSLASNLQHC